MSVKTTLKEKPVLSVIISLGVLSGSVVTISELVPVVDSWSVTHYEMQTEIENRKRLFDAHVADAGRQFAELKRSIDYNATYEKCTGLRGEMRMIESALYEAKQFTTNGHGRDAYVHELELDLEELRTTYSALECARILS